MKILVITNLYPPHEIGGYEIRCRDVCDRLRQMGHEIHVLTSDHRVRGRAEAAEDRIYRDLKIHGMYGHPWLAIHRLFGLERHNHRALASRIKTLQPDLIHVWNMGGISKSLLHRLEQGKIPVVYDVSDHWIARSLNADVWLPWWNERVSAGRSFVQKILALTGIRSLINRAANTEATTQLRFRNIYFCSAFMRNFTAAKGWPVKHAEVIHCGIDSGSFAVKQDHDRFEKLLWVGRLSEDKDPLTAVRALAAAHARGMTHLKLDLYGHGDADYVTRLDAEIATLGLSSHVSRKHAGAEEMRRLYSNYDALLFTSNWGEPFALTPLEAMASGLPVITSLDGGQAELAQHRINCLVAAAAEPEVYAERIVELAGSASLRSEISRIGLDEARRRFDIGVISQQIENFLQRSLPA